MMIFSQTSNTAIITQIFKITILKFNIVMTMIILTLMDDVGDDVIVGDDDNVDGYDATDDDGDESKDDDCD